MFFQAIRNTFAKGHDEALLTSEDIEEIAPDEDGGRAPPCLNLNVLGNLLIMLMFYTKFSIYSCALFNSIV